ncbi:MAG: hypothetical protein N3A61_06480, partial [Ignavibacteria bacterium]|nr:hypothetical protein [Ignavibacteria bacterium]
KVTAFRDDKSRFPEFELLNIIVVPHEFNLMNNYEQLFENEILETGMHKRYFLLAPPSSKKMIIKLSANPNEFAQVLARVFDPAGRKISQSRVLRTTIGENEVILDLEINETGIYEVVVHSDYQSTRSSKYNVKFSFTGYEANQEPLILTKEQNKFEVTKLYNSVFRGNAKVTLSGYQRQFSAKLDSLSAYNYKFYLKKNESRVDFDLSLSREDFNKFTDIALMIYDKDGNAVSKGGFTYKDESISVLNSGESDSTEFTLQIIGGFTHNPTDVQFTIEEKIFVSEPKEFKLKIGGNENLILYPYIKNYFEIKLPRSDWQVRENYKLFGKINFESSISKLIEFSLPFYFAN